MRKLPSSSAWVVFGEVFGRVQDMRYGLGNDIGLRVFDISQNGTYVDYVAFENNSIHNYFTEKLVDGVLAECLVFYWGCPNVDMYIDSRAYVQLSGDFEEDYKTILYMITHNEWERRLDVIKQEKKRIIEKLQMFPRLKKCFTGVTILSPLYNGVEFLGEAVESVKKQTHPTWEMIIGVNGVPLDSDVYRKAKTYECDNIIVKHYPTTGKAETLNTMLEDCKYDIICLLDVDDKFHSRKLEKQLDYIDKYDVVGAKTQRFGDNTEVVNYAGKVHKLVDENRISNCSCMLRKEHAYWDKHYESVEDYELWMRLLDSGKTFFNIPEVLSYHRIHSGSVFNTKNARATQVVRALYKHKLTFVTSYYMIDSKYPKQNYLEWIDNFFRIIKLDNCNLFVFTDMNSMPYLERYKLENVTFIIYEFKHFYTSQFDEYWQACFNADAEKKIHNVNLYKLWSEKTFMIEKVMSINRANWVYWIDIGCVRDLTVRIEFPNIKKLTSFDKITLGCIGQFVKEDYKVENGISNRFMRPGVIAGKGVIQGGFFGGSAEYLKMWIELYRQELNFFMSNGLYGGKDQYIMTNIYFKHPELFNLVEYDGVIYRNAWFGFLEYFGGAEKIDKSVFICGIIRNGESVIKKNIEQCVKLGEKFRDYKIFVYENNSIDSTKDVLKSLKGLRNFKYRSEDINNETMVQSYNGQRTCRIENIAKARNILVDEIRKTDCDYVVMVDLDCNGEWSDVTKSLDLLNTYDVVYANGVEYGYYYDLFALRCHGFPYGAEVIGEGFWQNLIKIDLTSHKKPITVFSAFGGLGVYKRDVFDRCDYNYETTIEVKQAYDSISKAYPDNRLSVPCKKFKGGYPDHNIFWKHNSGYKHDIVCEHVCFNFKLLMQGRRLCIDPTLMYHR